MITGVTKSGFSYEFDENRLDDMRYVDLLTTVMDDGAKEFDKIAATSRLMTMLLGEELKQALYQHIAEQHDGRVPVGAFRNYLEEIMSAAGEKSRKNS